MIFPLAAGVLHVVLNGTPVRSYRSARLERGRILAPVRPYVTAIAASIEYRGATIVVHRGDRFTQVPVRNGYVELAPLLRAFGARFSYDSRTHTLDITLHDAVPLATPTPFNPAVPSAAPTPVFTPTPQPTEKPTILGKPIPRRTPLPVTVTPSPRPLRNR